MAARGLTYFDADVKIACQLCDQLPTVENGGVVDHPTPQGEPGQKVTFRLKPGLKWDDGTPIQASDFVLAWTVGRAPDSAYSWRSRLSDEIWSVAAADARTVEIYRRGHTCRPSDFRFAPLPNRLEGEFARPGATGYGEKTLYVTAPTTRGLYSGPYRVSQFAATPSDQQRLVLERNPHWTGRRPAFDRVEFVYRPTIAAMTEAMQKGQVDLLTNVPLAMTGEINRLAPGKFAEFRRPGRSLMQVTLNHDDPRLNDVRVRRALLAVLDRPALAGAFDAQAVAARSFLTPRFPYFDGTIRDFGPDAQVARRLLDEAGWKPGADGIRRGADGRSLSFRLAVQRAYVASPFVESIVESWRQIGVGTTIEPFTGIGQLTARDAPPMALFGYTIEGGANVDIDLFDSRSIPKEGENRNGLNIFRYRSAETDRIVADLREGCAPEQLSPAYSRLQRRVAEDLPLLPLFFIPEAHMLPPAFARPDESRVGFLLPDEVEDWLVEATKTPK